MTNRPNASIAPAHFYVDINAYCSGRFGAVLLVTAVALVAGGANGAINDLLVQLAAIPLFISLLRQPARPRLAAWFALAALLVAALQLVPLPPALWTALPGRDQAADVLDAAGLAAGWRPLALDPGAAAAALAALFAPIVLLLAVPTLDAEQRRRLLIAVAVFAVASAVLGILQRISGGLAIYGGAHAGYSTGLMINRNHHADLIIAGILLLPLAVPRGGALRQPLTLALTVVICGLAVSVMATTSRAGMALAAPATLLALAMLWRLRARWIALAGVLLALVAALMARLPAYSALIGRFAQVADDERMTIAANTAVAIRHFWPWGSGYGSFVPVYATFEDLDRMHANRVIAAHNDYLQILLEGGLAGMLTLAGALAIVAVLGWRLASRRAGVAGWAPFAVAIFLFLHSAFDFPLRMAALSCLMAICIGCADAVQHAIAKGRINT